MLWSPKGVNLTWTTCIPLAALLAAPITSAYGPVVSCNILYLVCPPLAGWTCFLLCLYVTRRYWPSALGGYIFGFSPYMLSQLRQHLVLILVFPIPLAIFLVLRRVRGDITRRRFAILFAIVMATQFLFSAELFTTLTFLGGTTILLASLLAKSDLRQSIYSVLPDLCAGYGLALLIVSPYLYFAFGFGVPRGAPWSTAQYSADLANFLAPTPVNLMGLFQYAGELSRSFQANVFESSAYLSPALILIAAAFARSHRREPMSRLAVVMLVIVCIASLGPVMHVAGAGKLPLPGMLFAYLPIIDKVLPARLTLYAFLDLAIMVSLWFSGAKARPVFRYAIAIAVVILLLPNPNADYWVSAIDVPPFFSSGLYRQYIREDEVVLMLPHGVIGDSMLWQALTGMYFRSADGWIGPERAEYGLWKPFNNRLMWEFLADHDVSTIVVNDWHWVSSSAFGPPSVELVPHASDALRLTLGTLRVEPVRIGGVLVYRVPADRVAAYKSSRAPQPAKDHVP